MDLTKADLAALRAAILADPALAALLPSRYYAQIAVALNVNASPVALAWMTVSKQDANEATPWAAFDGLTVGLRASWDHFFDYDRDFARGNVRKWITDVWGPATAASNSEALLQLGTEKASRAEVIIGGTVKATGTVSALDRKWRGEISEADVGDAMGT